MGIIIDAALSSEASLIQELLPDLDHNLVKRLFQKRNPFLSMHEESKCGAIFPADDCFIPRWMYRWR